MRWWKLLCIALMIYIVVAGFLIPVPDIGNLEQTARNLFFHVPMWIAQLTLISISLIYSILYLRRPEMRYDIVANEYAKTGIVMGLLGLVTGAIWATYTWGSPWSNDPKQIGTAIALLIYLAYFVLRNSITDTDKRARVAAVYNIFAYFIYIPMTYILPRMVESLHPGGQGVEGNPGLNRDDLDPTMQMVFLPALIGWTLLGAWITTLRVRLAVLADKKTYYS